MHLTRCSKLALALAAAFLLAAALGPEPSTKCLSLTASADAKPLKKGARGARVKALQRALGLTPDGVYGPGTRAVVKRFQRRHHLKPDGIVGAATWRMIRRARGTGRA